MAKTILLADDSVTIQKVVELTFMDEDFEVVAVGNGDEALNRLEGAAPELLIADVHMPGANGYEVCRQAKQRRPGLPVLLLVGSFEPFDEGVAEGCGADGFLKKPFDSQDLLQRVEELLAGAAAGAPLPAAEEEGGDAGFADEEMDDLDLPDLEPDEASDENLFAAPEGDEEYPFEVEESAFAAEEEAADEEPLPVAEVDASGLELERSPWDEAEDVEDVAVGGAEGLLNTETLGALARDQPAGRGDESMPAEEAAAPAPEAPEASDRTQALPVAGGLSDADVDRVARRVVELLGDRLLREVAWEVVPDLAEVVIKERIRELERQLE